MSSWTVPGRVTRVIDGDTLVVDLDLGWGVWKIGTRVRLQGINCPELDTEAGRAAQAFMRLMLLGEELRTRPLPVTVVSKSLDKYGRVLGVVWLHDARCLNDLLVEAGHAQPA